MKIERKAEKKVEGKVEKKLRARGWNPSSSQKKEKRRENRLLKKERNSFMWEDKKPAKKPVRVKSIFNRKEAIKILYIEM